MLDLENAGLRYRQSCDDGQFASFDDRRQTRSILRPSFVIIAVLLAALVGVPVILVSTGRESPPTSKVITTGHGAAASGQLSFALGTALSSAIQFYDPVNASDTQLDLNGMAGLIYQVVPSGSAVFVLTQPNRDRSLDGSLYAVSSSARGSTTPIQIGTAADVVAAAGQPGLVWIQQLSGRIAEVDSNGQVVEDLGSDLGQLIASLDGGLVIEGSSTSHPGQPTLAFWNQANQQLNGIGSGSPAIEIAASGKVVVWRGPTCVTQFCIQVTDVSSGSTRTLATGEIGYEGDYASLSPDARWLAIGGRLASSATAGPQFAMLLIDLNTGIQTEISIPGAPNPNRAVWSPDSTVAYFEAGGHLYSLDPLGTGGLTEHPDFPAEFAIGQ